MTKDRIKEADKFIDMLYSKDEEMSSLGAIGLISHFSHEEMLSMFSTLKDLKLSVYGTKRYGFKKGDYILTNTIPAWTYSHYLEYSKSPVRIMYEL